MESGRNTSVTLDAPNPTKLIPEPSNKAKTPRYKVPLPFICIIGLLLLSFFLGAAVMFFQLPMSGLLSKCFMGVRAHAEIQNESPQSKAEMYQIPINDADQPGKTFEGYTLIALASSTPSPLNSRIDLLDMQRKVVHRWTVSFSKIWPTAPHLEDRQISDKETYVMACHLYANGDLLVVFHHHARNITGYGLAKVDKDSNLIWRYDGLVHHDVTVGEDGTIYTIAQRPLNTSIRGLESVPPPWIVDHLVMLSPDGKELKEPISILEALRNSPYSALLSPLETPFIPQSKPLLIDKDFDELRLRQDVLHANSVTVLTRGMRPKFPNFKPGQVLVSLRNIHSLALIDPETRSAVWGACGPWHLQHDAQFLENGNLLIFDNESPPQSSRVIEYNPQSGAFPWSYPGIDNVPFRCGDRGMAQRLPNGNTLIVNSDGLQILEVTQSKEVAWGCTTSAFIATARRYSFDQLDFLKAN